MKSLISDLIGGVLIIAVASGIGVAQNALRDNPVKLIQDTAPVRTVQHGSDNAGDASVPAGDEATDGMSVTVEQMKALFDGGEAVIIDARAVDVYEEGHIPGSINIPYDRLPEFLGTLQENVLPTDEIVVYCWSPTCDFSDQLATELKIMGYENVRVFTGGWEHWTDAGHPVTEGAE